MKTQKKKQSPKSSNLHQEIRHLGVLIEHVDGNVKFIAEQYTDIKKEMGGMKKTLDSHTEMIGNLAINMSVVKEDLKDTKADVKGLKTDVGVLKTDVGILKTDVKGLKTDVNILKTDVGVLKTDVAIIKTDVEFIKNGLKKKVDIDEFAALERRVALLERHR